MSKKCRFLALLVCMTIIFSVSVFPSTWAGACDKPTPTPKPVKATPTPKPTATPKADPVCLNLSSYFNEDAFSYDTKRSDGNYDGSGNSYSADLANAQLMFEGVLYTFGPFSDGSKNSVRCAGQTIDIADKRYDSIRLAGSSTNGDKSGVLRIHYTDGTYTDFVLTQKDWCTSSTTGHKVLYTMGHRHSGNADQYINTYIFVNQVIPVSGKTVTSITLPKNNDMHILAITLVPSNSSTPTPTPSRKPTPTPTPSPTPTIDTGDGLKGEYFDEKNLTQLKATRIDPTINFYWGEGQPLSNVGKDTFSVRWTGYIKPKYSETYTFYTITDDGVRLWVDNKLLIDQWKDQSATEHCGSIQLTANKKYAIKMEFYENTGHASAKLLWSSPSQPKDIIPKDRLYSGNVVETTGKGIGLTGRYYDHKHLFNSFLNRAKLERIDSTINFDWQNGSPHPSIGKDTFAVRWTGYIEPKYTENYTFYVIADDGVRLWIDDKLLINDWKNKSERELKSQSIKLEAGKKYKIKLDYYENKGKAIIKLLWSSPSQPKEIVPKDRLYPDKDDKDDGQHKKKK